MDDRERIEAEMDRPATVREVCELIMATGTRRFRVATLDPVEIATLRRILTKDGD